jgi:hypothetical protein
MKKYISLVQLPIVLWGLSYAQHAFGLFIDDDSWYLLPSAITYALAISISLYFAVCWDE